MRVALYTFGVVKYRPNEAEMLNFREQAVDVYSQVAAADGFLGHAMAARPEAVGDRRAGDDYGSWGLYAVPSFAAEAAKGRTDLVIVTLSLWRDVESAGAFSYGEAHRDALRRRREWFEPGTWPGHVLWTVFDLGHPTWAEGAARLEALKARGVTESYYTFSSRAS